VTVILLKNLGKLGKENDIVEVKDGYGRNYLLPRGLALCASNQNFKKLEEIKKTRAKAVQKQKQDFLKLKEKIDKLSLTITVEAKDDEELYGTIGEAQILNFLEAESIELEKGKIILEEPIKKLGVYNLKVNLYPEVEASLRLWIMKK